MRKNIIGPGVGRLRRARGLSVSDLAGRLAGGRVVLTIGALKAIEAGTRRVKDLEVQALAQALEVGVDKLFPRRMRTPSM